MSIARRRLLMATGVALLALGASGCATLPDPLQVTVAGIEPLPGEGMELRMLVKLRVQNPNDAPIPYTGAAVKLDVLGSAFATGVASTAGTIPRYGEAIVEVPVTVSVLRMARQVLGMLDGRPIEKVQYELSGKLQTGSLRAVRFGTSGVLDLGKSADDRASTP
jgi:LEA14-like dessication related protein